MKKFERTYDHGRGEFTLVGWEDKGLAVTRSTGVKGRWTVTHVESGMAISRVGNFRDRTAALVFLYTLLPLADWTQSADSLKCKRNLGEEVHLARSSFAPLSFT